MAITVHQSPNSLQAAYNDLIHVVSSDNYAQPNFRYIFDIYVNNGINKIHREAIPPHPTYNSAMFNPARILESYISKDFDLTNSSSYTNPNSIATYVIKYGEEYGLSSSGTTVYPNMVTSSAKYIWNAVFDWESYNGINWDLYKSGAGSKKLLTNAPNYKKVFIDSTYSSGYEFVSAINDSSGSIYFMYVETFDSSGATLGEYYIENNYQAISSSSEKMVSFPIGYNMNSIPLSDIVISSGTTPIISSSVNTYKIYGTNWFGIQTTEEKFYKIERTCSRYPLYEIYFLNKLGGYDTVVFNKKSNIKMDIKRENYKRNNGIMSSTSFTQSDGDRMVTQYSTNIDDVISLRSDYLSEDEMEWLEELVTSPDVYLNKSGVQVPVIITNPQFERKQLANEKLFNLSIDVKYSYKRYRQRF